MGSETRPDGEHALPGWSGFKRLSYGTIMALTLLGGGDMVAGRQATGEIRGVVRLSPGSVLEAISIENTTDPDACGAAQTLGEPRQTIDAETSERELEHVIVSILDPPAPPAEPPPATRLILDNRECRFIPHVAVARKGSELVATNADAVLHTTHLYGPSEMNLSLPTRGVRATRRLTRTGLYAVKCDIHGWMQAFVRVDDHPWHATSDVNGEFRIQDVPVGRFEIELWHPRLGSVTRSVHVAPNETTRLDVDLIGGPSR